jgi:hypothetical protein
LALLLQFCKESGFQQILTMPIAPRYARDLITMIRRAALIVQAGLSGIAVHGQALDVRQEVETLEVYFPISPLGPPAIKSATSAMARVGDSPGGTAI